MALVIFLVAAVGLWSICHGVALIGWSLVEALRLVWEEIRDGRR